MGLRSLGQSHRRDVLGAVNRFAASGGARFARTVDCACARRASGFARASSVGARRVKEAAMLRIVNVILVLIRDPVPLVDTIGRHDSALAKQLRDALNSAALNAAEG